MRRLGPDAAIVCALCVAAYLAGSWYIGVFNTTGMTLDPSQHEFGAAVAMACGRGFVDPGYDATPGLSRFLTKQADGFNCDEFPRALPPAGPNFTQRIYRYLMSAAALVWIARGRVAWSALSPLYGIFYALTIAAAYGLCRAAMRLRLLAVLASTAFMASAIHLSHLADIRDYAKAPFILALLLVMARMARAPLTGRRTLAYAAAFGAILGIGFGFRNDLLINVPPFVFVVCCCLPGPLTKNLRVKACALALAAAVFVLAAWPVVRAYEGGSNSGHVALLGLMTPFDAPLAIRGSVYDWGYVYLDNFVGAIVASYNNRVHGVSTTYLSHEYDRAAIGYLLQIARHWPADMIVRAYASVVQVLEMPFTVGRYTDAIPLGVTGPWATAFYSRQMAVVRLLSGAGVLSVALALIIAGSASVWTGVVLLGFVLYYAGYPAIQFHIRHFFHLEIIAWLALGFVIDRGARAAWTLVRDWRSGVTPDAGVWRHRAIRAAVFAVALIAIVRGGLTVVRAYQDPHVRALLDEYDAAPRNRLRTETIVDGGISRLRIPEASSSGTHYVIMEFSGAACGAGRLPVTMRYAASSPLDDFSRQSVVTLQNSGEQTRVFFPAFSDAASHFESIDLPQKYASCLTSVSQMTDARRFPVLLDMTLRPGWPQGTLHQTLNTERRRSSDDADYYSNPRNLGLTRQALDHPAPMQAGDVADRASFTRRGDAGAWVIRGRPAQRTSSLLRFADRPARRGDVLVAAGDARDGDFLIGLLKGEQWIKNVAVGSRGPFVVAIEAPEDGAYGVLLSADLRPGWVAAHSGNRVGRWIDWIPGATLWTDIVVDSIGWAGREEAIR